MVWILPGAGAETRISVQIFVVDTKENTRKGIEPIKGIIKHVPPVDDCSLPLTGKL